MTYIEELIGKYRQKGVFVDTNMLVLYIMGITDIRLVNKTVLGKNYTENDFNLVAKFIRYFDRKVTSPHILTETSDLIGEDNNFHTALKEYIKISTEKYELSLNLSENDYFFKFGLADSSIIYASTDSFKDSHLVFTADNNLYGYLTSLGVDAVNLDSLRALNP
jgi:hypothetical protein